MIRIAYSVLVVTASIFVILTAGSVSGPLAAVLSSGQAPSALSLWTPHWAIDRRETRPAILFLAQGDAPDPNAGPDPGGGEVDAGQGPDVGGGEPDVAGGGPDVGGGEPDPDAGPDAGDGPDPNVGPDADGGEPDADGGVPETGGGRGVGDGPDPGGGVRDADSKPDPTQGPGEFWVFSPGAIAVSGTFDTDLAREISSVRTIR